MAEYTPYDPNCCDKRVSPKRAILTLILLLNHDFERDKLKQGMWISYTEDPDETCPICSKLLYEETVIETSCLHRFHYDCLLHRVALHNMHFCPDKRCKLRIF